MRIVVRAHNEERNIGFVCRALIGAGWQPVVALSGCTDRTAENVRAAGAACIDVPAGLGSANRAILERFAGETVVLVDGDLTVVPTNAIAVGGAAAHRGFIGKGCYERPGRASSALAEQAQAAGIELPPVPPQALTTALSAYPADFAERVDLTFVPPQRGADLTLSLLAAEAGYGTVIVPLGPRAHHPRGEEHVAHLRASNEAALQRWKTRLEGAVSA